jgi:hypothetical protein
MLVPYLPPNNNSDEDRPQEHRYALDTMFQGPILYILYTSPELSDITTPPMRAPLDELDPPLWLDNRAPPLISSVTRL